MSVRAVTPAGQVGEPPPQSGADACTSVTIAVVHGQVTLIAEADGRAPIVAVMSPREAHKLRARLHKAANDAASAQTRAGATP